MRRSSRITCRRIALALFFCTVSFDVSCSFQPRPTVAFPRAASSRSTSLRLLAQRVKTLERPGTDSDTAKLVEPHIDGSAPAITSLIAATALSSPVLAAGVPELSQGYLDPTNFNPVCPASDFFYRFLQSSAVNVVGRDAFVEYGPLIAGGLLRVRLELCVVESFFNEAIIPFIRQNGLNWVLPLHETVETFLAGVVFAIATTFILVGSTKILIVIANYTDFLIGLPFRLFGGFAFDRAMGKPVTLDIGLGPFKTRVLGPPEKEGDEKVEKGLGDLGPVELISVLVFGFAKVAGQIVGFIREALDTLDVFVGRYLVLWASLYIGIKFLHFKVFPDFP